MVSFYGRYGRAGGTGISEWAKADGFNFFDFYKFFNFPYSFERFVVSLVGKVEQLRVATAVAVCHEPVLRALGEELQQAVYLSSP